MDNKGNRPLRVCSKCNTTKVPEGGVEMSATRWYCIACYRRYLFRK